MANEERIQRMRELRAKGYSLREIADEFGLSISTVYEYVKDVTYSSRYAKKKRGQKLGEEDMVRIMELRRLGKSIREIANILGFHYLTVRKYVKMLEGE